MPAGGWRYLATRLNGNGTETFLSNDVPLLGAQLREDLSGPGGITGTITPEIARLRSSAGEPLFMPWSTAVYAEKDGNIRAGAILADMEETGPDLSLDCVGFTGYLQGQPYTGDISRVQVDPLEMARHLWAHQQGKRGGNLGLVMDSTTSPVRVGTPARDVNFTTGAGEEVSFQAGPYTLQWWKDHDMGKAFDDLATETPFDYLVAHTWTGETISHRLRLGYPTIGRRRHDLRFQVGENIFAFPPILYDGDDYASDVVVLGAGEGRTMIRGEGSKPTGRLRRTAVVTDKTLRSKQSANSAAARELAARLGNEDIDTLTALDHPHAPVGSYAPGDEILIRSRGGWTTDVELWVRVLAIVIEPEKNHATLTVARTEKLG